MAGFVDRIKSWWRDAESWQRIMTVGVLASGVLAIAGWQILSSGVGQEMTPLFTELTVDDAAKIQAYLDDKNVPYKILDDHTIAVPESRVKSLRLELAAEGIPADGKVGFEIMESLPMGATDFERRVSYIRALQGEMAKTIEGFEEVKRARVHIVLPDESVFISESSPASAAVFLEHRPLQELQSEGVRAVMNLVSSGVKGLSPERVTVVDTQGVILSDKVRQNYDSQRVVGTNLEQQISYERMLKNDLKAMLEQVLGPGNVTVQVSAKIDFDTREVTEEMYEPVTDEGGLVTELERIEEQFAGTSLPPETGAGTDSNVPSYPSGSETEGETDYERSEVTERTVVNRIIQHRTEAPGEVERLSVAVVVNSELTPEQEDALTEVVGAALGAAEGRNDQIAVNGIPFDSSLVDQLQEGKSEVAEDEPAEFGEWPLWYYILVGLLLVATVGLVLLLRRRRRGDAKPREINMEEVQLRDHLSELEEKLKESGDIGEQQRDLLESIGYQDDSLKSTAMEMAQDSPARVADLLRTWLAENDGRDAGSR